MSNGQHAGSRKNPPGFLIRTTGAASLCTGVILIPFALDELFRYSPYGDPGALAAGGWLAVSAAALIGIPVATAALVLMARAMRRYLGWRRGLSPGERAWVAIGETGAMTGAHAALSRHNREESARLTRSVMGEPRDSQ